MHGYIGYYQRAAEAEERRRKRERERISHSVFVRQHAFGIVSAERAERSADDNARETASLRAEAERLFGAPYVYAAAGIWNGSREACFLLGTADRKAVESLARAHNQDAYVFADGKSATLYVRTDGKYVGVSTVSQENVREVTDPQGNRTEWGPYSFTFPFPD